tara:strand:- start:208 stop:1023 length:816 start_codon:yes stop_codon:yes gene_type:complete
MRLAMRNILTCILFSLGTSGVASASDDATAFRSYEDQRFYLYSQTAMGGYTCQMSLNTLTDLVLGIQAKIEAGELPMEIKDSLPSFSVTYTRIGDRLEFKRPSLSLAVKEGAEVASQERLEQGMGMIFSSFNAQLEMAIGLSQSLLHEFMISRHDVISDVKFNTIPEGYEVQFAVEGGRAQTRFDGRTKLSSILLASGETRAAAHFVPGVGGKLVLQGAEVQQPDGSALKMAFLGQDVSGHFLPAAIQVKAGGNDAQPGGFTVTFSDCQVN